MFSRAAFAGTTLLSAVLLVGCQNAPNQMSLYAPFGPQAVPAPSLTRANSTPYYTPGDTKAAATSPSTAANPDNKDLSHYDPYRGILVPGNFTPAPVLARSTDTWGGSSTQIASTPPRERTSNEAPIRVVESGSGATAVNTIAATPTTSRSTAVQFNATPLSGAVRSGANLTGAQPGNMQPTTINATEVARLPKPPAIPHVIPTTPVNNPGNSTPGLIPTPTLSPPPAPKPGEPRRISLWNDPGDGSRVEPASYIESATPVSMENGNWRAKK